MYWPPEGWTINGSDYLLRMSSPRPSSSAGAPKPGTPGAKDPRQDGQVVVELRDAAAIVRFSHPKGNSLPSALLRKLADEIGKIAANSGIKAIVLRSEGTGVFCAGASFDEMKAVTDAHSGREFFSGFARVILAMIRAPQFIIARVHGKVTGGGVGLVAASDYSFAVKDAAFRLSELAVGLGPFVIGPVVERKIGMAAFQALSIDADWRDAEWGERHGLYSRVVDDTKDLDKALDKFLEFLALANPEAIKQLKLAFWADTQEWGDLMDRRAAISGALALSAHTRAAIDKFEKR
jgi:methylglutaconyl-CoA hydratase